MDSKMPKSQEQSEQLRSEKFEATAGGRLATLVKNRALPGKVAKWAVLAVSLVGVSAGMSMPAHALNRAKCENGTFNIFQKQDGPAGGTGQQLYRATMCFANAGKQNVLIADVLRVWSGNNAGKIETNKGVFVFGKNANLNFTRPGGTGPLVIYRIVIL
ncbi:beta/gamma crystallin domain-containing protein [Phormidesmis sp. 146-35]